MYFVGIDVSKYKHDCFIVTEAAEVIKDTFTFDNTRTGFDQFFSILDGSFVFSLSLLNDILFGAIMGAIAGVICISLRK